MKLHIFSYKFIVIDIRSSKRSAIGEKSRTEQHAEKVSGSTRERAHFWTATQFKSRVSTLASGMRRYLTILLS